MPLKKSMRRSPVVAKNMAREKGYDMDYVELYWVLLMIVVTIICIRTKNTRKKLVMPVLALLVFFPPFIFIILTFGILLTGKKELHRANVKTLFRNYLRPKFLGYNLPSHPTIIIANYPSTYIEYLANYLLSNNICMLLYKGSVIQSKITKYFYEEDQILFVGRGSKFAETQEKVKAKIARGYTVLVYAEKKFYQRRTKYDISTLHSGIFSIARNISVPITPVVFDHIDHTLGIVSNDDYKIYVDRTRDVKDAVQSMDEVRILFRRKLRLFKFKR
jgi:hypothetical protein